MKKILTLIVIFSSGILNVNAQDVIRFSNGKSLTVFIDQETKNEIYYKTSLDEDGRFKVLKSDLLQINYSKGDSVIFLTQPIDTSFASLIEKPHLNRFIYHCWITGDTTFNHHVRKGFLQSVRDSGIVVATSNTENSFVAFDLKLNYLNSSNIKTIKLRRNAAVGKGLGIGILSGFVFGGLLGLAGAPQYGIFSDLPPAQNAVTGGILFAFPGMIIGGIIGSSRVKISINRSQLRFVKNRKIIDRYSYANIKLSKN